MTIVDIPRAPIAASIDWTPHQPTQRNRSEFTRSARTVVLGGGSYWSAKVAYPPIRGEAAFRPWRSFLQRVRGRSGAFRLSATEGVQHRENHQVVVAGAGQQGFALATRGWLPGGGLRDGMMMTLILPAAGAVPARERLIGVVADTVAAGADGLLTLQLGFAIPAGVPDGARIETRRPWGLMTMATDEAGWQVSAGQRYTIGFDCEEA